MIAVDLGLIDYEEALKLQTAAHEKRVFSFEEDTLFLLEHPPVITMGRSGTEGDLLVSVEELAERNIPLKRLGRGGKITCHQPGQMVAYPIISLDEGDLDIPRFVYNLEEVIIETLAGFGVRGDRIDGLRGIFVNGNKIASIGVEIRHGVSMHGISLNVFEDRSLYGYFVPCGIADRGIAFLADCTPDDTRVEMEAVKRIFLMHFVGIFKVKEIRSLAPQEFEQTLFRDGRLPEAL